MDSSQDFIDVIIAGAGGAGLTLGSVLKSLDVNFTIIEPLQSVTLFSKASGLHSNSLRLLSQIGLSEEMEKSSNPLHANNYVFDGVHTDRMEFKQGDNFFEKNMSMSQFRLESILSKNIESHIQRGNIIEAFTEEDEYVECTVKNLENNQTRKLKCRYLIASDGAKSSIRKALNYTFDGTTTQNESFTFDAKVVSELNHNEGYIFDTNKERLLLVPLERDQVFKFHGRIYVDFNENVNQDLVNIVKKRSGLDIDIETIQGVIFLGIAAGKGLKYRNSSRLASLVASNRIALIGDAAHVFEPFGGYGLNTAIEDAFTLAWRLKLALNSPNLSKQLVASWAVERQETARMVQEDTQVKKKAMLSGATREEKEIQIYDFPLKSTELIRAHLLEQTAIELGLFEKTTNDEINNFLYHKIGFKFIYCLPSENKFEEEIGSRLKHLQDKLFMSIKSSKHFVIVLRPDLFGKILIIEHPEKDFVESICKIIDPILA